MSYPDPHPVFDTPSSEAFFVVRGITFRDYPHRYCDCCCLSDDYRIAIFRHKGNQKYHASVGVPGWARAYLGRMFRTKIGACMAAIEILKGDGMMFVCSNRPKPRVQRGAKGHAGWGRDVYHASEQGIVTLCKKDCSEWLTLDPRPTAQALADHDLCSRCAKLLQAGQY